MQLVLFDVDKTLFMNSDPLMGQATTDAINTIWGLDLPGDAITKVKHPGQTATKITREILRREGLSDDVISEGLGSWCQEACARYLERLVGIDTSHWYAPPGTAEALSQIDNRALLTGNPEPVARARLKILDLERFFPTGQGAFGCDAEERPDLIDIARQRAGDWPRERTVAVGDTIADVDGGHAAGVKVIGFDPDGKNRAELAEADAVIESMNELPGALARLEA